VNNYVDAITTEYNITDHCQHYLKILGIVWNMLASNELVTNVLL